MIIQLTINGIDQFVQVDPNDTLLKTLRALGYHGVKFGSEDGLSGADTVLFDGAPVNAGFLLAAQAEGHKIATIEALGEHPQQGWKKTSGLHPLQQAFIETGAIQCGYCTPAQLLAASHLIEQNPKPSGAQVREALSGVLCRCTGYLKPVQAVLRAAAVLRGEEVEPIDGPPPPIPAPSEWTASPLNDDRSPLKSGSSPEVQTRTSVMPRIHIAPKSAELKSVGKPEPKVDAIKLAQGKPAFAADLEMRGMLYAKMLKSPHAHANIKSIDASKARDLPGVAAVLTHEDIPRVIYSTAGQSDPIPGPLDCFSLDRKVRFVGDRVAFVAAEDSRNRRRSPQFNRG